VTIEIGTNPWRFSSLRIKRSAASVLRRGLDEHVEDFAFIIDSAPQIDLPTGDRTEVDEHRSDRNGPPIGGWVDLVRMSLILLR
jgi:hypothetical protein